MATPASGPVLSHARCPGVSLDARLRRLEGIVDPRTAVDAEDAVTALLKQLEVLASASAPVDVDLEAYRAMMRGLRGEFPWE
jgi:hypothetical protein